MPLTITADELAQAEPLSPAAPPPRPLVVSQNDLARATPVTPTIAAKPLTISRDELAQAQPLEPPAQTAGSLPPTGRGMGDFRAAEAASSYSANTGLPSSGSIVGNTARQTASDFSHAGHAIGAQAEKIAAAAGQQYVQEHAKPREEVMAELYQPTSLLADFSGSSGGSIPATAAEKAQALNQLQQKRDAAAATEAEHLEKINAPVVKAATPAVLPVGATLASAAPGVPLLAPVVGGSIANAEGFDATDREQRAQGVPPEQSRRSANLAGAGAGLAAGVTAGLSPGAGAGIGKRLAFGGAVGGSQDLGTQLAVRLATGKPIDWKQTLAAAGTGVAFDAGMQALGHVFRGRAVPNEYAEQMRQAKTPQDVERVVSEARSSTEPIPTPAPTPEGSPNVEGEARIGPAVRGPEGSTVERAGSERPGGPGGVDRTQKTGEGEVPVTRQQGQEVQQEEAQRPEVPGHAVEQAAGQPQAVRRADELTPTEIDALTPSVKNAVSEPSGPAEPAEDIPRNIPSDYSNAVQAPPAQAAPVVSEQPAGAESRTVAPPPPAPVEAGSQIALTRDAQGGKRKVGDSAELISVTPGGSAYVKFADGRKAVLKSGAWEARGTSAQAGNTSAPAAPAEPNELNAAFRLKDGRVVETGPVHTLPAGLDPSQIAEEGFARGGKFLTRAEAAGKEPVDPLADVASLPAQEPEAPDVDYHGMSMASLRKLAKDRGVAAPGAANGKQQLIDWIKQAEPNAAPPIPREKPVGSAEASNPANTEAMFPTVRTPATEVAQARKNAERLFGPFTLNEAKIEAGRRGVQPGGDERTDYIKALVDDEVQRSAAAPAAPKVGDTVSALSRGGQPVSGVVKRIAGRLAVVDQGDGIKTLVPTESLKPFAGGPNSSLSSAGINDPYMDPRAGVSSLQNLTEQVAKVTADKPSIVQRMRAGSDVGATVTDTSKAPGPVGAVASAYDRLKGSIAAVFDAYKSPPKDTTYDKATRFWSGADNMSALEINRFRKSAEQAVPDKVDRGAIGIYIEAGGDQAKLDEWAKAIATNPSTRRYAEMFNRATRLPEQHRLIGDSTAVRNEATLNEARDAGLLKDGVENYLMHVWADNPAQLRKVAAEANWTSLSTNPSFTKQRTIPTYFEGIQKGLVPKDLDFASLTAAHERAFRQALAARAYIKTLSTAKASDGRPLATVSPASAKELPPSETKPDAAYLIKPNLRAGDNFADYRPVDHPALRGWRWAGNDSEGKPIIVQGDMLVHPEIYRPLKNNLTPSAIQSFEVQIGKQSFRPGAAVMKASTELKHAILSFSAFHQTTLGVHALEHRVAPAMMPDIDLENPVHRGLIDHGLMVAHYDANEAFGEGVASGGLVTKIPGIGPLYHAYSDYLFKDYLPRVKMAMATHAMERNQQRYRGQLSQDQIYSLTADQANAAFGGLNYRALGRNRTLQDVLRLTLMAPDFLEARGRFVGQAVKPYGREQAAALVIGAAAFYTAGRILNTLLDGDPHWDRPFSVVHGGKDYELRTVQGDLANLIKDPARFVQNRLSPLASLGVQLLDRGNYKSAGQKLGDAAKRNVPMPVQSFTQPSTDSVAERVASTIAKLVGINIRPEDAGAPKQNAADKTRQDERAAAAKALREKSPDAKSLLEKVPPAQRAEVRRQAARTDQENDIEHWSADKAVEFYLKQPAEERTRMRAAMFKKITGSKVHSAAEKAQMVKKVRDAN
jgi:hypothetical protein